MSHREHVMGSDLPAPDSVPPTGNPDPQPGDPKPKAPPSGDDNGRRIVPVELPGKPNAPERVDRTGGEPLSRA
jgi:hypothetical protein